MNVELARLSRTSSALALLGASALAINALVHFQLFPEHTNAEHVEMGHAYIGWLFIVGTAVLVVALLGVARDSLPAWHLGALTTSVMLVLLLVSRYTAWLPNGYQEEWEPAAVVTLVVEVIFLSLYATRIRWAHREGR